MFIYPLFRRLHNPLTMSTFSTCLIITGNLQVALDFYTAAFAPHTKVFSGPTSASAGSFSSASIVIYGHKFILLNMGPEEKPSPAASFMITCNEGQEEINSIWYTVPSAQSCTIS
jgi:predicted 3-demethylubiquinone-9 3-methyltransferase (glyoxalase superfamily)